MTATLPPPTQPAVVYPESDGQPMSDNTLQFDWIVAIKLNLEKRFDSDPQVFVAGDLLWYPVEGDPKTRVAPDALVAFGRPKGRRGSYLQWLEGGITPQVVFEVLSPGNTLTEMAKKLLFYERFGVEEYYLVDPDRDDASGWVRQGNRLAPVEQIDGWTSPRLGIRFEVGTGTLRLRHPDGAPFESFVDVSKRAEQAEERAERIAAKLRALGVDPDQI